MSKAVIRLFDFTVLINKWWNSVFQKGMWLHYLFWTSRYFFFCFTLSFETALRFKVCLSWSSFYTTKLLAHSVFLVCVGLAWVLVGMWLNFFFVFSTLLHFILLTFSLLPPSCLFPSPPFPSPPQDHCSGTCSHLSSKDDWLAISNQAHLLLPLLHCCTLAAHF